jgi:glucose/arabinose dehydrogenase
VTLRVPRAQGETELTEERTLTAPGGVQIAVFAAGLRKARFMAWSPEGDLVITETNPTDGRIVILPDRDGDGAADERVAFAERLRNPHGLAFRDGFLYVAEEGRVARFAWQGGQPAADAPETIVPDLPAGRGHYTRTLGFGPDDKLYVSIGSSCNVCAEQDERRAAIMQYNADGSGGRVFARGLRNAVGFVWRPGSDELWATNNGRDGLGEDLPPETVNLVRDGDDFGWPYCHNGTLPDPQLAHLGSCDAVTGPAVELQAHSAPLGLAFYTGDAFPAAFRGDLLVAFHGSWNRAEPTGYKLVRVRFQDGRPTGEVEDFISGWLGADGEDWGRPVDTIVAPDGSLYLSDDGLGVVYRITYAR